MGAANDSPSNSIRLLLLPLFFLLTILSETEKGLSLSTADFTREDFPPDFVFGAGTSAYQYEGAVAEDGRTPSVWDTFTHQGGLPDKSTGDVAADGYHKYKEDIQLMINTGLDAYRFSISWSRLIPNGRGKVNPKGLEYYNNVIDELVKHGIQPHVTLYQFDLPQSLEDEYGGWLSPKIVDDFEAYADVCFKEFGDRVLHWTTINEPNIYAVGGYDLGILPPNRCSSPFGIRNCTAGNSTTEPYIALHHELLAHLAAANLYKTKYQAIQNGLIGANVYTLGFTPFMNSTADIKATERAMDFLIGCVLDPLVNGDYPQVIKEIAGSKLPTFTKQQSILLRGSFNFIGLNHYTTIIVKDASPPAPGSRDFFADMAVQFTNSRNETPTGRLEPTDIPFSPDGLEMILNFLRRKYGNPAVYIHENGIGMQNGLLNDTKRIHFLKGYIGAVLKAIRNGSNTKGYIMWSFLDVFEFLFGYRSQLGLYYVDFNDKNLRRVPKSSAIWYRDLIKKKDSFKEVKIMNFNTTSLQRQDFK